MSSPDHLLRSLEIAGFKSFARATRLEFPQGITAFVGANGSGKSNVVDAIRWCLGEQSTRDLRGQRAEDVIHAGPRRVLGNAEVALHFEGESGLSVARRLHRSGDSEYIVNGERRRLRDLQDALRGAGVDHPRFVVVTQGMTDFLLSATPSERRGLLEQAAGLSAYRLRRDEAVHRLEAAGHNIATIEIILAELEPRLRALRRQARAADESRDLARSLLEKLALWYACRSHDLYQRLAALTRDERELAGDRDAAQFALTALEDASEQALARERAWRAEVDKLVASAHHSERERDAARHDLTARQHEVRRAAAARSTRSARLAELEDELARVTVDLSRGRQRLENLEAQRGEALAEVDAKRSLLLETDDQWSSLQAASALTTREAAELEGEQRKLNRERQDAEEGLSRAEERCALFTDTEESRRQVIVAGQNTVSALCAELARLDEATAALKHDSDAARRRVEIARARRRRLDGLLRRATQREQQAQRQLDASRRTIRDLDPARTVLPHLTVPRGWERAVSTALGRWVAPTSHPSDAFFIWRGRLAHAIGRGRWADSLLGGSIPGHLFGTIFVEADADVDIIWDRLRNLSACEIGSPPIQIVSRSGVVASAYGCISEPSDDGSARYLRAVSAARVAEEGVALWCRRVERGRAVIANCDDEITALTDLSTQLEDRLRLAHQSAQQKHRNVDAEQRALERERAALSAAEIEQRQHGETAKVLRERLSLLTGKLEAIDGPLKSAHHRRDMSARRVQAEAEARSTLQSGLAGAEQRARDLLLEIGAQRRVDSVREKDRERLKSALAQIEEEARTDDHVHRNADAAVAQATERLAALENIHRDAAERLAALRDKSPLTDVPRDRLVEARARLRDVVANHERVSARLEEMRAELVRLREEMAGDAIDPAVLPAPVGPCPSDNELRRLRIRVAQAADIDPAVIGEYRELQERRDYLTEQLADLRATGDGLREIMTRADAEMRSRFADALATVSSEFGRVFRTMLQGGSAALEQVDTDGGLDIRAVLPGKRARSSASFSGGERALVASALLFGVLHIRPAPFVVLDEVDAALDETNVDRYLDVVRDISVSTQVLVVTHNRATMAAANVLYGLTMDREGASTILSLRLDDYDAAV